jgi:uridine kinase
MREQIRAQLKEELRAQVEAELRREIAAEYVTARNAADEDARAERVMHETQIDRTHTFSGYIASYGGVRMNSERTIRVTSRVDDEK